MNLRNPDFQTFRLVQKFKQPIRALKTSISLKLRKKFSIGPGPGHTDATMFK